MADTGVGFHKVLQEVEEEGMRALGAESMEH